MLQDIQHTGTYRDDTLVGGMSENEHLRQIFKRMREYNFYLSKEKYELSKPHIEFLGHVLSNRGIHTDPNKVAAIQIIQRQNVTKCHGAKIVLRFSKFL